MKSVAIFILIFNFTGMVCASENNSIYRQTIEQGIESTYSAVYKELENNNFYVVFESTPTNLMQRFKERWGEQYNQKQLTSIKNMVVCSVWYVNQVANFDPDLLSLCPLRVSMYEKDNMTTVVFARPTVHARNSSALPVIQEVEDIIIKSIQDALGK